MRQPALHHKPCCTRLLRGRGAWQLQKPVLLPHPTFALPNSLYVPAPTPPLPSLLRRQCPSKAAPCLQLWAPLSAPIPTLPAGRACLQCPANSALWCMLWLSSTAWPRQRMGRSRPATLSCSRPPLQASPSACCPGASPPAQLLGFVQRHPPCLECQLRCGQAGWLLPSGNNHSSRSIWQEQQQQQ